MGTFTRLRYVMAANVNALIEKAEDPEKLLRALIREMEDASEDARLASAELLAEQQRLDRLENQLTVECEQWKKRAEKAVEENRDDLARAALKASNELLSQRESINHERELTVGRIAQMEQDMSSLKSKLADAKLKLKSMHTIKGTSVATAAHKEILTPGEQKVRRAMDRFDRLQTQVENLEARVRSYEVGGPATPVWGSAVEEISDPAIEEELARIKQRVSTEAPPPRVETTEPDPDQLEA